MEECVTEGATIESDLSKASKNDSLENLVNKESSENSVQNECDENNIAYVVNESLNGEEQTEDTENDVSKENEDKQNKVLKENTKNKGKNEDKENGVSKENYHNEDNILGNESSLTGEAHQPVVDTNKVLEESKIKDDTGQNKSTNSESTVKDSSMDYESIENQVYNIGDDTESMDNTDNIENDIPDREPDSERPSKRALEEVITIDSDSDDSSICHVESYQATASEAKKLRKGYSSSESSSSSCSLSSSEDSDTQDADSDTQDIISKPPSILSKCVKRSKKDSTQASDSKLNECFSSETLNEEFLNHWSKEEPFESNNLVLHSDPFQICILDNFLSDEGVIDGIVDDMMTLEWSRRIMDLYEFHRTSDLKELTWQRSIKSLYDLLKGDVLNWVAKITNTNLTHISASCALYGPGDHLLVHDDLYEDRKIAFIYYMVPWYTSENADNNSNDAACSGIGSCPEADAAEQPKKGWTKSMGGALEFFGCDSKGQPTTAVKSFIPKNNAFAFFKVSPKSFHQVSEILSYDYPRLTINGWFHGPIETDEETKNEECEAVKNLEPKGGIVQKTLNEWITPIYFTVNCKSQILQKFEDTSEISLVNYFIEQKYNSILEILESKELEWQNRGPVNLRNYQILPTEQLKDKSNCKDLEQMLDILTSKNFIILLQEYTGLPIQSYCKLEIQRWTAGSYSVLPLKEEYSSSEVDVSIYLGCPDRLVKGGTITYLLPEETEPDGDPVISVGLKNNALNIVYSEAGLAKFTKHVSKLSFKNNGQFYLLVCSYRDVVAQ